MEEINLNPEQLDYILRHVIEPSKVDWINLIIGSITILVLIFTFLLQARTTKLIVEESRIKLMPYFDIEYKGSSPHNMLLIRGNKELAFDFWVERTKEGAAFLTMPPIDQKADIISPGEFFSQVDFTPKGSLIVFGQKQIRTDLFKAYYSDIEDRQYSQIFYALNGTVHVGKPVLLRKKVSFSAALS